MKRVFKFCIIIVVVITFFIGGSYIFIQYQEKVNEAEKVIKVACVGDSNTYRHGGTDVQEYKYSYHLGEILGDGYEVRNFGEVGACVSPKGNVSYTSLRVFQAGVEYEADIVIVMLGTNDVWDHNWINEEYFKQEYLKIIDSYFQAENSPEVYLCTLPKLYQEDGSTKETGSGEHIESLSNVIREIAAERGCQVVEINQVTDKHPEWYMGDNLHINEEGAKGVAQAMANVLLEGVERGVIVSGTK